MPIQYLRFEIAIHGIEIKEQVYLDYLTNWLRTSTYAGLMGNQKDGYNYRGLEGDIEIEITEQAGKLDE